MLLEIGHYLLLTLSSNLIIDREAFAKCLRWYCCQRALDTTNLVLDRNVSRLRLNLRLTFDEYKPAFRLRDTRVYAVKS